MVLLPEGEKKSEEKFNRFDGIPACECDEQMDRQTDGHLATAQSALYIASCGKSLARV